MRCRSYAPPRVCRRTVTARIAPQVRPRPDVRRRSRLDTWKPDADPGVHRRSGTRVPRTVLGGDCMVRVARSLMALAVLAATPVRVAAASDFAAMSISELGAGFL